MKWKESATTFHFLDFLLQLGHLAFVGGTHRLQLALSLLRLFLGVLALLLQRFDLSCAQASSFAAPASHPEHAHKLSLWAAQAKGGHAEEE